MLSYSLEEANDLLQRKMTTASQALYNAVEDLEWLREQITVTEVNVARVYNWDIKMKRQGNKA